MEALIIVMAAAMIGFVIGFVAMIAFGAGKHGR